MNKKSNDKVTLFLSISSFILTLLVIGIITFSIMLKEKLQNTLGKHL